MKQLFIDPLLRVLLTGLVITIIWALWDDRRSLRWLLSAVRWIGSWLAAVAIAIILVALSTWFALGLALRSIWNWVLSPLRALQSHLFARRRRSILGRSGWRGFKVRG